jgi:hypothetical protein
MKKHSLIIATIFFASLSFSQNFLNTDRIAGLYSPYTLKKKSLQLEYGIMFTELKEEYRYIWDPSISSIEKRTTQMPLDLNLRYGLFNRFELNIGYSLQKFENDYYWASKEKDVNSKLNIGGRYQLVRDRKIFDGLVIGIDYSYIESDPLFDNLALQYSAIHKFGKKFHLKHGYRFSLLLSDFNRRKNAEGNILLFYSPFDFINISAGLYYYGWDDIYNQYDLYQEIVGSYMAGLQFKVSNNLYLDFQAFFSPSEISQNEFDGYYDKTFTGGLSWNIDFEQSGMEKFFVR